MRQKHLISYRSERKELGRGVWRPPKTPGISDLKDTKSSILAISWHLFPSSVIRTCYDFIFVFFTLPGKREYFEIHVHKKWTKPTPEELKAIALMSAVTLKKNSIRSWVQLYCSVEEKKKNSAIFYSFLRFSISVWGTCIICLNVVTAMAYYLCSNDQFMTFILSHHSNNPITYYGIHKPYTNIRNVVNCIGTEF